MLTSRFEPASRKNVDRTRDSYLPRKGPLDVGVCPDCHAISRKKRWYLDEAEYASLARTGAVLRRCPACRKIADGFPSGVVTLRGDSCGPTATRSSRSSATRNAAPAGRIPSSGSWRSGRGTGAWRS